MQKIFLFLRRNGWIRIKIKAGNRYILERIIDKIRELPVIKLVKDRSSNKRYYITSIHHLDFLYRLCMKNGYEVYTSKKLNNYHKRFKLKLKSIKQVRSLKEFHSRFWSSDSDKKVLDYQAQAINVILRSRKFMEGDDMGSGKTIIALGVICKAFENDCKRALIVCPNRLKYQWKSEVLRFTVFKDEDVSVIDLSAKVKCPLNLVEFSDLRVQPCKSCHLKNNCREMKTDSDLRWRTQLENGRIVIANYEILDRMKKLIPKRNIQIFILDEASKIKNFSAVVAKAALYIGRNLPFDSIILPMSGTFIENKIEEMYPPLVLVDKGIVGEMYNFKARYLMLDFMGNVIAARNEKKLKKHVDRWIIRRPIEEIWKDRPKLIEKTEICKMTSKQRKIYDNARDGILRELEDKQSEQKINAAQIGALINYLIQICDSTETMDSEIKESGKIDSLKEILSGEIASRYKVVIFSFFANKVIPIIEREVSQFGRAAVITGNTNLEKAERIKKRFMRVPNLRFLICSDSMSYGSNLQIAKYVINFDLPWNPAVIDQRIRRVYRRGQKQSVMVINLVTDNSIEDNVLEKIGEKRLLFNKILGRKKHSGKISLDTMLKILKGK